MCPRSPPAAHHRAALGGKGSGQSDEAQQTARREARGHRFAAAAATRWPTHRGRIAAPGEKRGANQRGEARSQEDPPQGDLGAAVRRHGEPTATEYKVRDILTSTKNNLRRNEHYKANV